MTIEQKFERRFTGVARLYGDAAYFRFQQAHIAVIGVGGVGSWAAEALARSGVGKITLIDLDHIAESNINRQVHSIDDNLGLAKVLAMANRINEINSACQVIPVEDWITVDNLKLLLAGPYNYVIDAIDQVAVKAALVHYCLEQQIPLITTGSAGGRFSPSLVTIADLAQTTHDPLAAKLRRLLRGEYGFPGNPGPPFGVPCVYSTEPIRNPPQAISAPPAQSPGGQRFSGLHCAGYGSSVCVTATFGFFAAGLALQTIASETVPPLETA